MTEKRELRNFINGEFTTAASGAGMDVINPSTGEVYATAPCSGPDDIDAACRAAQRAFDEGWRDTTPGERMTYMLKLADAIESNAERLVAVESENTGKPRGLTMSEEIPPMVDQVRFFAGAARMLEGRSSGEYMNGFTSWIRRGVAMPVVSARVTRCTPVARTRPVRSAISTGAISPS